MEPVTLRYVMTPWRIVLQMWLQNLGASVFFTASGSVIVVVGLLPHEPDGAPDIGLVLLGLGLMAIFWIVTPLSLLWVWREAIGRPIEMSFSEEGIRQDAWGRHFQGDWSVVAAVRRRGPYLLLKLRPSGTLGLPDDAFESPAQRDALLAAIKSHIAGSQPRPADPL